MKIKCIKIFLGLIIISSLRSEIYCKKSESENVDEALKNFGEQRKGRSLKDETETTNLPEKESTLGNHQNEKGENIEETHEGEASEAEEIPQAEKFIGLLKKKHPQDLVREKMIGMIFTGKPEPLGIPWHERPAPPPPHQQKGSRRIYRIRPARNELSPQPPRRRYEGPREILKPMPFVPRPAGVELTSTRMSHAASGHPEDYVRRPPAPPPGIHFRHDFNNHIQVDNRPSESMAPTRFSFHNTHDRMSVSKDMFSNTDGPDFGPVTFEDFGSNFENQENEVKQHIPRKRPIKPLEPLKPVFKASKPKTARPPVRTFEFSDSEAGVMKDILKNKPNFRGHEDRETCQRYTEDICLDTDNYPHQEILKSLSHDPTRSRILMAEVREQSADDLVDGISSSQEAQYDYSHYYGNRRKDSLKPTHRDFAEDGGYLCPSEVKYARPKRARNSKGEWKFIVNMDKYSQTIRMEKCMKPGGTCSYVSHHYRATCNQIYNYQRLLSWEKERGLHMDIYKVPSCCSCHIQGYAYLFPPLKKDKDHHFAGSERIDKFKPIDPQNFEEISRKAPSFSPVNFPNMPPFTEARAPVERNRPTNRLRTNAHQQWKPKRRDFDPKNTSAKRSQNPRSQNPRNRVNYDYHPIIDFFEVST